MALEIVAEDKIGRNVAFEYCDVCAKEQIYPALHPTLYRLPLNEHVMLCELHAIIEGLRPPTPDFERAFARALAQAQKEAVARRERAIAANAARVESARLQPVTEQGESTEDRGSQES